MNVNINNLILWYESIVLLYFQNKGDFNIQMEICV